MNKREGSPSERGSKSIRKVIVFCLVVGALIIVSLFLRLSVLLKNSSFDGKSRFTIAIVQPKDAVLYSFDPLNRMVRVVTVLRNEKHIPMQRLLGIPIDANVQTPNSLDGGNDPSTALIMLLAHPTLRERNINELDILRLFLFTRSLTLKDIKKDTIVLPLSEAEIDSEMNQLFIDSQIVDENISIEIVNGTNIPGLGKRLERLITHMGGTVVSITNSPNGEKQSRIQYFNKKSATLKRLQKILAYPVEEVKIQKIADIVVILGNDTAGNVVF